MRAYLNIPLALPPYLNIPRRTLHRCVRGLLVLESRLGDGDERSVCPTGLDPSGLYPEGGSPPRDGEGLGGGEGVRGKG